MAIAFRNSSQGTFSATATPIVSAPSGLTNGDLIIVSFATDTLHDINSIISGWIQIGTKQDYSTDTSVSWFYKIASSEGASWTFTDLFVSTNESGVYGCVCYSGVDTTTPLDVAAVQGATPSTTNLSAGSITPISNDCMVVSMFGADPGSAITMTPDAILPCTERIDTTEGTTTGYIFIQDHLQTTATEETHTATSSAGDGFPWTIIALRPATGGTTAVPVFFHHYAMLRK